MYNVDYLYQVRTLRILKKIFKQNKIYKIIQWIVINNLIWFYS